MIQFVTYFISGFLMVWINLFMWGFSNGPASATPYLAVIGSLILFVMSATMSLFLSRIAACIALVGIALMVSQPFFILLDEKSFTGFFLFAFAPGIATAVSMHQLWKTRNEKWLLKPSFPSLFMRIPLALVPTAMFFFMFNARLVLTILVKGFEK